MVLGLRVAKRGLIVGLLIALLGLLGILSYLLLYPPKNTSQAAAVSTSAIAPPAVGGAFQLTSHNGRPFTDADLAGHYNMIAFGFTHCPDICPGMIQTMLLAKEALPTAMREEIRPIFVTIDPARDTVPVIKNYVEIFSPRLLGLTGDAAAIEQATSAYKVFSRKIEQEVATAELQAAGEKADAAAVDDYLMDHSSLLYITDKTGKVQRIFSHHTPPAKIAAYLLDLGQISP